MSNNVLDAVNVLIHLKITQPSEQHDCPHYVGEEPEPQRGKVTCLRSHSQEIGELSPHLVILSVNEVRQARRALIPMLGYRKPSESYNSGYYNV